MVAVSYVTSLYMFIFYYHFKLFGPTNGKRKRIPTASISGSPVIPLTLAQDLWFYLQQSLSSTILYLQQFTGQTFIL